MKHRILAAAVISALTLSLAACGNQAEIPAQENPDAPEGITISDGRMTLPAVSGNPGAIYFTVTNSGERDKTIRAVSVAGAQSAMLHQTSIWNNQVDMQEVFQVNVTTAEPLVFEPGGLHVMAMDLDESLVVGGETEVTLSFAGGDKASFPVEIRAAGEGE